MKLDTLLKALSHGTRREILWLVWEREALVGELAEHFGVAGPTITAHLKLMRDAGLVDVRPEGTRRWYRARPEVLTAVAGSLLARQIPAEVHSEVALKIEAPTQRPAFEIALSAVLPCSVDEAWAMWTDPEQMDWCGTEAFSDPTPGGAFGFTVDHGMQVRGVFDLLFPPSFLSFSWDFSAGALPLPGAENIAEIRFSPAAGGAAVQIRQLVYDEAILGIVELGWLRSIERLQYRFDAAE